ncbi:lipopolysaccharide biosynthesis protein [Geodermatophilus marinus]|uniref:lipopolysaccharide biosynthesis protein n=1 Tax=Geodermatophilus sp. LHW52908 TaxID=2303986 RepID=UPI001F1E4946|nr:polysaccharide biosynthesis C-terminal domain-containing protein [Geodermatophilus sp. LHW52908]
MASGLANLANPIAAIATAPILAQVLGPDGRGAVAAATAPLVLMTTAALLGIPEAVTYVVARTPGQSRPSVWRGSLIVLVSGVASTLSVVAAASYTSGGDSTVERLTVVTALALTPALLVGVQRGRAAGLGLFGRINAEKYIGALVRLGGIGAMAALDVLTVTSAVAVIAAAPIIAGMPYLRPVPDSVIDDSPETQGTKWGSILHFGLRIWIGTLSGVLLSRLDQVLMAPLSSLAELGFYVVAVNVADLALIFNNAVRDVLYATEAKGGTAGERAIVAARLSAALSLVLGVVLASTMTLWLPLVFGPEFAASVVPAAILLLAGVTGVPGSIAGAILSASGRPGLRSTSMVAAATVNIILLFLLAPALGAVGAAIATLIGSLIAANANIIFVSQRLPHGFKDFYGVRRTDFQLALAVVQRLTHPQHVSKD